MTGPNAGRARYGGVISDLDGTLYRNLGLQREFEAAYVHFVADRLDLTQAAVLDLLDRVRTRLTESPGQPPGELRVLKEMGLRTSDWFNYSCERVAPERHLEKDVKLAAALRSTRMVLWLDVATNTAPALAHRILSHLGISQYVDGLWTAADEDAGKPSPGLYRRIIEHRRLIPSRVIVLGDRWHVDMVGVRELGMEGWLVKGPKETRQRILAFYKRISTAVEAPFVPDRSKASPE